jgi:hypothetical protein
MHVVCDSLTTRAPTQGSTNQDVRRAVGREWFPRLDRYGIPLFYQQPTVIYNDGQNEIWKPSFTLYSYSGAVVDYVAGTSEDQQEQRLGRDKMYWYNKIPAAVSGPKDLEKPNWDEDLYAKLEQLYQQAFDPMRYTAVGTDK